MRQGAVIYLRTSTEGQVDKQGPKVQEDACREYAQRHGWDVVSVRHEAAVTGKTDERPEYEKVLASIEDGEAEIVLVSSLDRLARTLTVQEDLLAQAWSIGAEVHAASYGPVPENDPDDPYRTFMRQVMGAASQLDHGILTKRMRDGRKRKKADGGKAEGQYRFGYTKQGPDRSEQRTLARIHELVGRDGLSFEVAATTLNQEGHMTRSGRAWSRQNLAKVCSTADIKQPA